jgi:hypothetical protein
MFQEDNAVMLEVTSIRNLRPREGKEALHLVFSPALFPPASSGGLREGVFPASALLGEIGRDRDFVTKEVRIHLAIKLYPGMCRNIFRLFI